METLTADEERRARELLLRPMPDSDMPMSWRQWASDLTWIVPRYAAKLLNTLDARADEENPLECMWRRRAVDAEHNMGLLNHEVQKLKTERDRLRGALAFATSTTESGETWTAAGTAEECEAEMRRLTNGERGCTDPSAHSLMQSL